MPYISRELLRLSLDALNQTYSPLLMVSLPCMTANNLPTLASASEAEERATPYGTQQERKWLNEYFQVPGGPVGKPYYMPATQSWVEPQYPGRSLQRQRKVYADKAFYHPDEERWAIKKGAASVLKREVLKDKEPIPLVALMAWMWRNREVPNLKDGLQAFVQSLGIDRDAFVGSLYDKSIPAPFSAAGLSEAPASAAVIAELLDSSPPPPAMLDVASTVAAIEATVSEQHFLTPPGLINRVVSGWLVGDVVVLVGSTGTGKTRFSGLVAEALKKILGDRFFYVFLEISPDYDVAQFFGYQNLAGEFAPGRFVEEVLFVGEPTDPRLVVLDEWNLAQIDSYFAPVLSALESKQPLRLPGRPKLEGLPPDTQEEIKRAQPSVLEGLCLLPEDTFFLATCNSWVDEPETRLPISGPVKRRCRIIQMPNVLEIKFEEKAKDGIVEVCNTLLQQERAKVRARLDAGQGSVWDKHRADMLDGVETIDDLEQPVRDTILQVAQVLLKDKHMAASFTPGILQDTLLTCAYTKTDDQYRALGQVIADKILPQLQGEPHKLEVVVGLTKDFPNAREIRALAEKMGAYTGDTRLKPLV